MIIWYYLKKRVHKEDIMNKIVISSFYNNKLLGFVMNEDRLIEIIDLGDSIINNIYAGRVKDINKSLSAMFVEIGDTKGFCRVPVNKLADYKQGDKVLVQVVSDKVKTKEYGLSTNINLKNDWVVLSDKNNHINISKKITDESTRTRLKNLLKSVSSDDFGFVVRTLAANADDEDIIKSANNLAAIYADIKNRFNYISPRECLYKSNDQYKELSAYCSRGYDIVTDDKAVWDNLSEAGIEATFYENANVSLPNKYALGKKLENALSSKVWLKSGGYLVIEYTESLTAIDVNTGKYISKKIDKDETFWKVNKEAAEEIFYQLRLRNISGIVIVDFINMGKAEEEKLLEVMKDLARLDAVQCEVFGFTSLGLVEISRQKTRKWLKDIVN